MQSTPLELSLASGTLRAHRFGAADAPLVLCVHGLSANALSFGAIGPALAARGLQAVALDLRGRGCSPASAPGTLGWEAHARDVAEAAARLGAARYDVVGHSMGAYVTLALLGSGTQGVRRAVLIDALGPPQEEALGPIGAGLRRLQQVYPSREAYVAAVRDAGAVRPWGAVWEAAYAYEVRETAEGARARTDAVAVLEDLAWGKTHDAREYWPAVRCPVLAVRASQPLPGGGEVLTAAELARFGEAVPQAECLEVEANHYGVMTHAVTVDAVVEFLSR